MSAVLGELFYWIFNMSIIASLMGLIVLPIRSIRVLPRRLAVLLWVVPFLRMLLPVGFNSPYSLMTLVSRFTTRSVTVYQPAEDISFSLTNFVMAANSYFPITYRVKLLDNIFAAAALIWMIVALAILVALGILYFSTLKEMKKAKHLRDNIYLAENIQGPAVYGIWKPRIILPASYANKELQYILKHEATHIRRWDNLWRMLAFFTGAVHWFNPLAWLFLKRFLSDIELACDEAAIAKYGREQRQAYARALVDCAESKSLFISAFGGARIRTRIEHILSYKRMTVFSLIGFFALIVSIVFALLTNAG